MQRWSIFRRWIPCPFKINQINVYNKRLEPELTATTTFTKVVGFYRPELQRRWGRSIWRKKIISHHHDLKLRPWEGDRQTRARPWRRISATTLAKGTLEPDLEFEHKSHVRASVSFYCIFWRRQRRCILSPSTFVGGVENNGSLRRRGENFADLWSSDDRAPYTNQTWGEANEKEKIHFFVSKNENPKSTLENPKMGGKAYWKKLPLGTSWFLRFSINCASHLSILVQERSWSKTQDHCPYTQGNGMETYIGKIERAGKRHGMQWSGVRIHARSNSTQGMSMLEASNCKISFSKFNTGNMST